MNCKGDGVDVNLKLEADNGYVNAMTAYSKMLKNGINVGYDGIEAEIYEKMAEENK